MINISEWLIAPPPEEEITKDKIKGEYLDITVVERLLDDYCKAMSCCWSRKTHHYSFHTIGGEAWLATSLEIHFNHRDAHVILCGSFIRLADYPYNRNMVQTGISEATKAGVKILGNRFGKSLNDRGVPPVIQKDGIPLQSEFHISK